MDQHTSRPVIPRDAYVAARKLASSGQFEQALRELDSASLSTSASSSVNIFKTFGLTSLEEANYELAYQAYMTAYLRAQATPSYGAAQLLDTLCEPLEVSRLAAPQMHIQAAVSNREKLEQEIFRATSTPACTLSSDTIAKVLMAAGEVGATFEMSDVLEDYLNGSSADHLNSAAHDGLFHMLYAHRCHLASLVSASPKEMGATEAYQEAYRILRNFPEYALLKPYARLCSARVSASLQDLDGMLIWLHEAADELVALPSEVRSPASVARVLNTIAIYAASLPELQHLFFKVYDKVDMPIHHVVKAYALWSEPSALRVRLIGLGTPEKQGEAIKSAESIVRQADELSQGVVGITSEVRAQLNMAKAHLAAHRGDFKTVLSALKAGFAVATTDLRAIDIVWTELVSLAWNPPEEISGFELLDVWKDMLAMSVQARSVDRFDVGNILCQALVGVATALPTVDLPPAEQARILLKAVARVEGFFGRHGMTQPIDIHVLAVVLGQGSEILKYLPVSAGRSELAIALRLLLQRRFDAPESLHDVENEDIQSFLRVEHASIMIYGAVGELANKRAAQERAARLQEELDTREHETDSYDGESFDDDADDNLLSG